MENEEWLFIDGFNQSYMVSNLGNVKSLERDVDYGHQIVTRKERTLKPCFSKGSDYPCVNLYYGSKKLKRMYIHRLVATAFIKKTSEDLVVNHKNGIKGDNVVSNLEWVTHSYNTKHAYDMGLNKKTPESTAFTKLDRDKVSIIREMLKQGCRQKFIGEMFGVNQSAISMIKMGKSWK